MKIIFVARSHFYQQLGIMYLSSIIDTLPIQKKLCLARMDDVLSEIDSAQGKVVLAYSVMSYDSQFYIDFNRALKRIRPEIFSIMGGPHPTFHPQCLEEEGIDAICLGEGEWAFLELCEKLLAGEDYTSVRNFWFKRNASMIRNSVRPLDPDISKIPFPDQNMFFSMGVEHLTLPVFASRGCPFSCSFCFNHQAKELYRDKGPYLRFRDPQNVIDEIQTAERKLTLKIRRVFFMDSTFIYNKPWLHDLCALYKKEIKIPFSCTARADLVDEETIALLKDSGCCRVGFGAEVGNEAYRMKTLKKNITNDQLLRTAALLRKHKLKFKVFNMLGLPHRSLANDIETLKFNWRLAPDCAHASLFTPLPGTLFHEELVSNNLLTKQFGEENNFSLLKKESNIKFEGKAEKRQIENFYKFFTFCARFPIFYPLVRLLITLPFDNVYHAFHRCFFYFFNACIFENPTDIFRVVLKHNPLKLIRIFFSQAKEY
ncbi:MAG: radical SAM protein [Candidatus Omnitrophota bacterium]